MNTSAESAYHYIVRPECESNYFVHGNAPNYSPSNVTVFQNRLPDWVQPAVLPKSVDLDNVNEICNPQQLFDRQVDIASQTFYYHTVYKIWNAIDLENFSNLSIDFDPAFQTLTLHECKVFRNGIWINKLDMNELRVIQKEPDLGVNVYSADLSALLFLEDVREGDILDYSYSISGQIFSKFSIQCILQDQLRWEKQSLRIIKPSYRTFQSNIIPSDWDCYLTENENELVWEIEPCPSNNWEPDQPPGYPSAAQFEMSEFSNWSDVASLMIPLCRLNDDFKQDPEVLQLVDLWKKNGAALEEQALLAVRFVQDEIRYTGIETGIEAIQPTDPLVTLKRRFGDCKGKSQLLRAFLDVLGIHSDLCLVSTKLDTTIQNHLPSLSLFNHAILQIELPDQVFYVDATALYEGGTLAKISCPYGAGLIISEKTQDLVMIPMPTIHPEVDCQTAFDMESKDSVKMSAVVHLYGRKANHYRLLLKYIGLDKMLEPFQKHLKANFGPLKSLSPIELHDERLENHITIAANLLLENPWIASEKKTDKYLSFIPYFLAKYFLQDIDANRTTSLQLPSAQIKESVFVKGGRILTNTETIEHKTFTFHCVTSSCDKVDYELFTHFNELSPEDLDSYLEKLDEAFDEIGVTIKRC